MMTTVTHGIAHQDLREGRLEFDGRIVAWSEVGEPDGRPLIRLHGTPGSRYSLNGDRAGWAARGLRVISPERPGYGISTRLPGRGFGEVANDIVAVLDHLGIRSAPFFGFSGGGPFVLAVSAHHPERVRAATIACGSAPVAEEDLDAMIEINARAFRLALEGDAAGLRALAEPHRSALLDDAESWLAAVMASSPAEDRAVLADPTFHDGFVAGAVEAVRLGAEGWVDDSISLAQGWDDLDLATITTPLVWWHGTDDRNSPARAVQRVIDQIPGATLRLLRNTGHLLHHTHEAAILDELLDRQGGRTTPLREV